VPKRLLEQEASTDAASSNTIALDVRGGNFTSSSNRYPDLPSAEVALTSHPPAFAIWNPAPAAGWKRKPPAMGVPVPISSIYSTSNSAASPNQGAAMAKSNRETKKPKKDKVKTIAAAPSQKGATAGWQPTFGSGKKK